MTKDEIKELASIINDSRQVEEQKASSSKNKIVTAIAIGLTIAIGGNFIGWFATKSTADVENVTRINQTLEFMQTQQDQTNAGLKEQIQELKESLSESVEEINDKLDEQFTREDFNREMIYRDQDVKRLQGQIEELFDKVDEIKRN